MCGGVSGGEGQYISEPWMLWRKELVNPGEGRELDILQRRETIVDFVKGHKSW